MARIPHNNHWDGECLVEFVRFDGVHDGKVTFTAEYEWEITNKGVRRTFEFSYNLTSYVYNDDKKRWETTGGHNNDHESDTLDTNTTVSQETYNPPHDKDFWDHRHLVVPVASGRKYRAEAYVTLTARKNPGETDAQFPANIRSVTHKLVSAEVQA